MVAGCCSALDYLAFLFNGGGSDEANAKAAQAPETVAFDVRSVKPNHSGDAQSASYTQVARNGDLPVPVQWAAGPRNQRYLQLWSVAA